LASGVSIATAGPGGALVVYCLIGTMVYGIMSSLGEMTTYLPISFNSYGGRFFDPALSFVLGWNYWFNWAITVASELVAAGVIMSFWVSTEAFPAWAWALIFLAILISINIISVLGFGEAEFWFALLKVLVVIVFVIIAILVVTGVVGGVKYGTAVFDMSPFHGGFIGVLNIFLTAGFSFQGSELVGIAAGESSNPRKNVPKAISQVFWRILLFYVMAILMIGLIIPYNDPDMSNGSDIKASPFTLVFERAGIKPAAHIMNAVILVTILSAGNSGLYAASRSLFVLSQEGNAPGFLSYVNSRGVPIYCVLVTAIIGCAAFIVSIPQVGSGQGYVWLLNLSATSGFIAWICIGFSHIRFRMAYNAQQRVISELPFVSKIYPVGPIYTIILGLFILVGQGYSSFYPAFMVQTFCASYITIPIFFLLYFSYKIINKTSIIPLKSVDLDSGSLPCGQDDKEVKKNILLRIFEYI